MSGHGLSIFLCLAVEFIVENFGWFVVHLYSKLGHIKLPSEHTVTLHFQQAWWWGEGGRDGGGHKDRSWW